MLAQSKIDEFIDIVRTRGVSAGPRALGRFVFGTDCAIVTNGVGFRGVAEKVNLVSGDGKPLADHYRITRDHSLNSLGLEALVTDSARQDLTYRGQIGMLVYRSGILMRILDKSYAHLSGRVSGGQRTLRHQLVKSTFVESFSLAEKTRMEARYLLEAELPMELEAHHDALSSATVKAAKLMGGHGFLASQSNALEFLSNCTLNQAAQVRSVAATEQAA